MPRRRRALPLLFCLASLVASQATADEFSWQLGGTFGDGEVGGSADTEISSLSATYFFRPVDDANGPYALAPFLERASHIGASYQEDKAEALVPVVSLTPVPLPPISPLIVTRGTSRALSGRYVFGDAGWYVGARLAETDADAAYPGQLPTSFSILGDELTSRSVSFGRYLGAATTIALALEKAEATAQSRLALPCTSFFCSVVAQPALTSTLESEHGNIAVSAQHVGRVGRMRYALSAAAATNKAETTIEVVVTQPAQPALPPTIVFQPPPSAVAGVFNPVQSSSQRRERYEIAGELFPTQALGIRVGYARWSGELALDYSYEVGTSWFFRRNVGAEVLWSRTEAGLSAATTFDIDTVTIRFVGRL